MAWPTGAPTRRPVAVRLVARQLAHLATQRPMSVHDTLGVRGGARGVPDDGRAVGIDGHRAVHRRRRRAARRRAAGPGRRLGRPRRRPLLELGQAVPDRRQLGQEVALAVRGHDDEGARSALAQDEPDLLGSVEVHDRHDRHAEDGAGVERDGGLHPVRQLEGDDVARAEAVGAAGRRPRTGPRGTRPPPSPGTGWWATRSAGGARGPRGGRRSRASRGCGRPSCRRADTAARSAGMGLSVKRAESAVMQSCRRL